MNLINWLCKHFDTDNKGYVTIGNILVKMIDFAILIFGGLLLLGTIELAIVFFGLLIIAPNLHSLTDVTMIELKKSILVGHSIIFGCILIYYSTKIKVAKCHLKQK